MPELGCFGHKEYSAEVRNYGKRDPKDMFDVYCFAKELDGKYTNTHTNKTLGRNLLADKPSLVFSSPR